MTTYGLQTSKLIEAIRLSSLIGVINAIDDGGDVEEPDVHGFPGLPLRTACFIGNLPIVRELLGNGANPNAEASDGPGAPLKLALRRKHFDSAALLLQQGAAIPEGVTVDPAVYAISCAPLALEAVAPLLPASTLENSIEYAPTKFKLTTDDELPTEFGTQTTALGTDLLFLDEEIPEAVVESEIEHLMLEPWPEKESDKV